MRSKGTLIACCLALVGCVSSGRFDPYRARDIRPAPCRLAQASPPGRESVILPSCPPGLNAQGRAPTPEDWKRLAEYDLARQLLESGRIDKIDEIADRVDELAVYEQQVAEWEQRGMTGDRLDEARAYISERKATYTDWIAKIDEALALADREQESYRRAMEHAARGERIVWHSSRSWAGWLPERYSAFVHGAEAEPAWWMGIQMGSRYAAMRAEGEPPEDALLMVAGMAVIDLTGVTNVIESMAGSEVFTGKPLGVPERVAKGVLGIISVASLAGKAIPRVGPFVKMVRGSRLAVLQMTGPSRFKFPVLILSEAGRVLALSESEAFALVQVMGMQMVAVGGGGTPPQPVPGLKGGVYGKTRGGGSAKARAYQKKVTGREDSVYVNGVEFDGWWASEKALVDAKRTKGPGSWYDVTGDDSFTQKVKIPEIEKQAKRQVAAMRGSGAARIEWVVSDPFIKRTLAKFFKEKTIPIDVTLLAP